MRERIFRLIVGLGILAASSLDYSLQPNAVPREVPLHADEIIR